MFFVFGPSGQVLRGGPEALGQIESLQRLRRSMALRARTEEGGLLNGTGLPAGATGLPARVNADTHNRRVHHAVSAYAQAGGQTPQAQRRPLSLVQEVMRTDVVFVTPLDLETDAWHRMSEQRIGQAPVLNAQGRVVGLLRWADMAPQNLGDPQASPLQQAPRTVAEVMLTPSPTVSAETSLRRLAVALLETGLTGLPVTNEIGLLEGYVSRSDILRAVAAEPPLDLWSDPTRTW